MTPALAETRVIEIGSPQWCWSRLHGSDTGTLSGPHPSTPSVPVSYLVSGQQIHVANHPGSPDATNREVTLEVMGTDLEDGYWLIRATGEATPVFGEPARALVLSRLRIRGYHELCAPEPTSSGGMARDRYPSTVHA